jgi:NADH-quinone oxidoreductase subunit L
MSPLFELSESALSVVMVIGAITALFMALVAIVQNDIKRVVAYSTLSQLGYMTVALGASAYAAGIFHLVTHAFFKALLFLAAGSVIIALHHQQDMRKMGGLKKYMPVTYWTLLIGAIASAGIPGFSGFFSKDAIIEAVHLSQTPGAGFAHFAVLVTVFVTALYTFRLVFMTFHGAERFRSLRADPEEHKQNAGRNDHQPGGSHDDQGAGHGHAPHESPAVVTVPLILLAIPSICAGWVIGPMLFGGYFGSAIVTAPAHDVLAQMGRDFHGVTAMMIHSLGTAPFWLAIGGVATAAYLYLLRPDLPAVIKVKAGLIHTILERKYGFDEAYQWLFGDGAVRFGTGLWKGGDVAVIDGVLVDGSARVVGWFAGVTRYLQSGYIYHYAFAMIVGMLILMTMIFIA